MQLILYEPDHGNNVNLSIDFIYLFIYLYDISHFNMQDLHESTHIFLNMYRS